MSMKNQSKGTYSLSIERNTATYFNSFEIEYSSQVLLSKIKDKSITHNIIRIKSDDYIMCGRYCIAFMKCIISGKTLLNHANLFSCPDHQKNDKIMHKYFKEKYRKRKCKPRI